MTTEKILPVILCGGSGSRLWPLSRKLNPKQFIPLIGDRNLFEQTLERIKPLVLDQVIVITAEDYRFYVIDGLKASKLKGIVVLEPAPKNTTAAIALACLKATENNQNPLLLICPSDHFIPDQKLFENSIFSGIAAALKDYIVTFGAEPSFPSVSYGYLEKGDILDSASYNVNKFIEKPNLIESKNLLLNNNILWNTGIFLAKASVMLDALNENAPDILSCCKDSMATATSEVIYDDFEFLRPEYKRFITCRSQSIDYSVLEKHPKVATVIFKGIWNDLGNWDAIIDTSQKDQSGNSAKGRIFSLQTTNTFMHASSRLLVAIGIKDLIIVETNDAVLVAHKDHSHSVGAVFKKLEQENTQQVISHSKVLRPWGSYEILDQGDFFKVKRICVKPGARLSLQQHNFRSEHWVVVKGCAEINRDGKIFILNENESTFISKKETHRLSNPTNENLEIIEIQTGNYLEEDDIIRLEDEFGRN
jgi:mannose-1-phosphate guanylyltransferase/mannose-6-phosphate isomerase